MGHLTEEGKFNSTSYLLDAEFMKLKNTLGLYLIENEGVRILIDTGESLGAKKLVKKLEIMNLLPIHKIFLTHAHWDHIQALPKLQKLMKTDVEVLAHQNALEILENPEEMNEFFGFKVKPIENVTPLKEHDIIDLNGLKLTVIEFFGHTQDSIAIYNEKTKNLIVGDAIIDQINKKTYLPVLFGPKFEEKSLLATYKKLRELKPKINSISLAHYGTYTDQDCSQLIDDVENLYFKAKNILINAYNENPDIHFITEKYHDEIIPDSPLFTKETLMGLHWSIEQHIKTLKAIGFIK